MEDAKIIELYWARAEDAIRETAAKYGKLCHLLANNILASHEDSEECVNDTYLTAWDRMPPKRPEHLSAFLGRITRNLALKRCEYLSAGKRNPEAVCSLEELADCVSGQESIEAELENRQIETAISQWLWSLDREKRDFFLWRYWYFESVASICRRTKYSPSKVKSSLFQLRRKLKNHLESEGITL